MATLTWASLLHVTIKFRVRVNLGLPPGTLISNQGSVDSSSTVPEPTDADGVDANGDQPTVVLVGPVPLVQIPFYVEKLVGFTAELDLDGNAAVTAGDGVRYTLVFMNLGGTVLQNISASDTIPTGLTGSLPPVVIRRILTHLGLPTAVPSPRPPPADLFGWSGVPPLGGASPRSRLGASTTQV